MKRELGLAANISEIYHIVNTAFPRSAGAGREQGCAAIVLFTAQPTMNLCI
jgi:hypothetical protein